MTDHFLAYAGPNVGAGEPPRLLVEALRRYGCTERWRGDGLVLFATEQVPLQPTCDGSGVVLGHLFGVKGALVDGRVEADLRPDGARRFIDAYWGSYVALCRDQEAVRALRDPSGGLGCYHACLQGSHYFTSLPHLLIDCGLLVAEIDWEAVACSLTHHSMRTPGTALRGIDEVLPGSLQTFGRDGASISEPWDPWRHAAREPQGHAAEVLEEVLCSTLGAWGRCTRRPLIEISGGLDSAVVAAGIALRAPRASLITFAAALGDPDETAYARAIADRLGLPLEISVPRIEDVDLTRSLSADLPRPNARAFTQAMDARSLDHARAIGADAFLSGGGGDDVFCYLRTILPALDRYRAEGVRPMLRTARDIAIMTHSTFWEALPRIVRRLAHGCSSKSPLDVRFLHGDFCGGIDLGERAARDPERPGKAEHIRGVRTIHNYLEGHARARFAPILSPLLSQPIVECCLGIQTWLWCDGGANRAVARRAFSGRLPQAVIQRRSKGSFDAFCARLLYLNRKLAYELLVEGRLAAEGIVDREAIMGAMRNPSPPAETVSRLLALIDIESWLRSWISRPCQRA